MSSKTTPTTLNGVPLTLASLAVAAFTATGIGGAYGGIQCRRWRAKLPVAPRTGRHKFLPHRCGIGWWNWPAATLDLPLTVFSEADEPSQLFGYYLLDTTGFPPNVFTSIVPGINDNGVIRRARTSQRWTSDGGSGARDAGAEAWPPDGSRQSARVHRHVHRHLGPVRHQQRVGLVQRWMLHDLRVPSCLGATRRRPRAVRDGVTGRCSRIWPPWELLTTCRATFSRWTKTRGAFRASGNLATRWGFRGVPVHSMWSNGVPCTRIGSSIEAQIGYSRSTSCPSLVDCMVLSRALVRTAVGHSAIGAALAWSTRRPLTVTTRTILRDPDRFEPVSS